ncbi:MAG TPA: hydroxymethylglutaryl-CoA lyase [Enhygromyxa sp.]|nr:hydroxymethylglutaryl-CoA lyase [Enhygromyxa sp.]
MSESQPQTRPQARAPAALRDTGSGREHGGAVGNQREGELFEHLFDAVPTHVDVYEVGPRDGLQNEKTVLPIETKLAMIESLVEAGVKRIEITSFVNPRWIPALADHMELATRLARREGVRYTALVPNMRGLDSATRAGMDEIAIFMAASETHNRKNINKSTHKALETYAEVVEEARSRGMLVRGYVSCVYGCPYEGDVPYENVEYVSKALVDLGVYELSLGDTIGVGTPRQVATVLRRLLAAGLRYDQLAVHFHDTRGTALANVTVALQLGIRTIDSSLGGLGGCPYAPGASGNVATEDVVYLLDGMGVHSGVELAKLPAISVEIGAKLGHELPSKYLKAHVGACAKAGVPV